jgi:hypothetical protein
MTHRSPFRALAVAMLGLAAAAAIAVGAFQAGSAHGFAEAGRSVAIPSEAATHIYVSPHPIFLPFGPLFALLIAFLVVKAVLWGGPWRRGGCGRGGHDGVPPAFEEWHRRVHERQDHERQHRPGTPPDPSSRT